MNVLFSLVLLRRGLDAAFSWRREYLQYIILPLVFLAGAGVLAFYFQFLRQVMEQSAFNLINFSMQGMSVPRLSLIFGVLWFDLCAMLLIGVLLAFFLRDVNRSRKNWFLILLIQVLALTVAFSLFPGIPRIPFIVIYLSLGILMFLLPRGWIWFERLNPLSRFIAIVLLVSVASFLC